MTPSPIHALILNAVQHVSSDRLQKAVCGLADGSLTVTLTRQSKLDIRALVTNGAGIQYGVTLTETLITCSCKDALYRGGICKHGVAVALHVLRTPQPQQEALAPQFPTFHLMWRNGIVVCGDPHAGRVQMYPWTAGMIEWPETCSACVTAYTPRWEWPRLREALAKLRAVALALYVIRTPETKMNIEMPAPDLRLAKANRQVDSSPFYSMGVNATCILVVAGIMSQTQ